MQPNYKPRKEWLAFRSSSNLVILRRFSGGSPPQKLTFGPGRTYIYSHSVSKETYLRHEYRMVTGVPAEAPSIPPPAI